MSPRAADSLRFATLAADAPPVRPLMRRIDYWLNGLVESLSGVVFARDLAQLQFSPRPTLNIYTPITLDLDGQVRNSGEPEFADALIGQINKLISEVTTEPGRSISFSTRKQDGKAGVAEVASDGSEWVE